MYKLEMVLLKCDSLPSVPGKSIRREQEWRTAAEARLSAMATAQPCNFGTLDTN